jgi:UDP-glucose-4-epimerase GalE
MNILVTGGAGYIGSHTAWTLSKAGYTPVVFDNLSMGHAHNVRWGPFVEGDLADSALLKRTISDYSISAVIHFAAHAYVGESVNHPRKYFQNNSSKALNLVEACLDEGVGSIVFSSTCATYGNPTRLPIGEEHAQCPVNPYGESKLFVERILHWFGNAYGLRWNALRYFNAAGAHPDGSLREEHEPETHLIPLTMRAALNEHPIEIYGTDYDTPDGTAIRDYVHVLDLADAHVLALERLLRGGDSGAFNLGTGAGHSVREVIAAVRACCGHDFEVRETGRRPGDSPVLVADASKAKTELGWHPDRSDMETIVQHAWNSLRPERAAQKVAAV